MSDIELAHNVTPEVRLKTYRRVKSCPFCGRPPIITRKDFVRKDKDSAELAIYRVSCPRCDIGFGILENTSKELITIDHVLEKWNMRAGRKWEYE